MSARPEWRDRPASERVACNECGRNHSPRDTCDPPPREYHDAPFLKKFGS